MPKPAMQKNTVLEQAFCWMAFHVMTPVYFIATMMAKQVAARGSASLMNRIMAPMTMASMVQPSWLKPSGGGVTLVSSTSAMATRMHTALKTGFFLMPLSLL